METNPYKNIALEAYLMELVPEDACIMYLWQNRHTVVIGRNQNAFKECRVKELEDSGGFLARRLSGGGAVYHDMGNLNFTFIMKEKNYNLAKQTDVILRAVLKLGVKAEKTGRNDIETDGRKFSGNAFYKSGGSAYHHGTLLVNANKEAAAKYLSVSKAKIRSKGVDSVKSRIVNLTECNPDITIPALIDALKGSFGEVYSGTYSSFRIPASERLSELEEKFSSPEWKYGKNPPFRFQAEERFDWGSLEIRFDVESNKISQAKIFSDAMETDFVPKLEEKLKETEFTFKAVRKKIVAELPELDEQMAEDIAALIFKEV